ncbi:MAG: HAMP domain-containing protein [Thermodesulfobacteria bacterium]|nr:HAMP domain-containing protein [Thermodesulfobacteriota bacterium]
MLRKINKKLAFFIFFIPVIIALFWLEFNIFNFSFLSLSQKNILLFLLFQLNLIFILVLLYFIFKYLFKIFWEIKVKKISKSIKTKLFATYFISIVFPSIILVLGSFFFFKKTIDYWLKSYLRTKFISQVIKTEDLYKEVEQELFVKGEKIVQSYISKTDFRHIKASILRKKYRYFSGLDSIEVYTYSGKRYVWTASPFFLPKTPMGIPPSVLDKLKNENLPASQVLPLENGIFVRVFIPCKTKDGKAVILATGKVIPLDFLPGKKNYPEKKYLKLFKKFLMLAGFSVLLLVIFIGIWVGSKIGRNLTEPLHNLVLATQKLSKKEFSVEESLLASMSEDEIGILIRSFKEMTQKLKEYEEELRSYGDYLNSLLNHLPVGVLILSEDFRVKYLNFWLRDFLIHYQFKTPEEFLKVLDIAELINSIDLDEPFYRTYEFVKEDKRGIVGITIIKLIGYREKEFMIVVESLEEKERLKRLSLWKEVAARIAHEIKNPLTPIKLSVERLKKQLESELPEEKKRILERTTSTVEKYVEELRRLAVDFYYFSKKPTLSLEKAKMLETIIEAISLYELAYPDVKFNIKAEDDGECCFDPFQFKRVWINLIDNSIKAMREKGEINIFLTREGKNLVMEFSDTGEGIPEDIIEKIDKGEIFKLKEVGTGLIMVYTIVQLHRGSFKIEKNSPKGTKFIITIPC